MTKEKVIQVSGGSHHTLILTQRGNVYSMGGNYYGELGSGDENNIKIPSLIDSKHFNHEKIIQICCGSYHSMALTQKGNVYSWGIGHYGQLGHVHTWNEKIPVKIDSNHFDNEKIKSISAGSYFSFATTKNNKLYAWGENKSGRMGLGDKNNKSLTCIQSRFLELNLKHKQLESQSIESKPRLVDPNTYNNEKIIKVSCGHYHTFLLTEKMSSNNLYACGFDSLEQLGLGNDHNKIKYTFQLVDSNHFNNEHIKDVSASDNFSMVLTEQNGCNKLYTWGNNTNGRLGLGDEKHRNLPQEVDFSCSNKEFLDQPQIKHIGNGSCHCFAIIKEHGCEKSKIYAWGDDEHGQLGLDNFYESFKPDLMNMDCFKSQEIISIGGNCGDLGYSFAICKTGKLFVWGCNRQNQLGLGHCKYVHLPQQCCTELFGVQKTNPKIYNNQSFEDISIEF